MPATDILRKLDAQIIIVRKEISGKNIVKLSIPIQPIYLRLHTLNVNLTEVRPKYRTRTVCSK